MTNSTPLAAGLAPEGVIQDNGGSSLDWLGCVVNGMFRKREFDERPEVRSSAQNKPTIWLYMGLSGCAAYLVLSFLLTLYLIRYIDML